MLLSLVSCGPEGWLGELTDLPVCFGCMVDRMVPGQMVHIFHKLGSEDIENYIPLPLPSCFVRNVSATRASDKAAQNNLRVNCITPYHN